MKIWIDILTPKQLLFSEEIVEKLGKNHSILCTSRHYHEVEELAKIRKFKVKFVGKHGKEKRSKLILSNERMQKLTPIIANFAPDLVLSFASPEAARISFGLGINHYVFCDSPHADAVMRLTIPLIQKLFIPKIISKQEFSKFGIDKKNIICYNAIDASITIKRKIMKTKFNFDKKMGKKNILIRLEEKYASYAEKSSRTDKIIDEIIKKFHNENILILARYKEQMNHFKKLYGNKIKIFEMKFDGRQLLKDTDLFIGSGGTMTAEAALSGVPTISFNAIPNRIEEFLVKRKLVLRETSSKKITKLIDSIFSGSNKKNYKNVECILEKMENPVNVLLKYI